MKQITKTLNLPEWIVAAIQDMADKEKRSFTKQMEVVLGSALGKRIGNGKDSNRSSKA